MRRNFQCLFILAGLTSALLLIGTYTFRKNVATEPNKEKEQAKPTEILTSSTRRLIFRSSTSTKKSSQGSSAKPKELDDIRSCVPFYNLIEKHVLLKTGKRSQEVLTTFSLISAFEYENYSVITTEADDYYGRVVFCRYLDNDQKEIKPATKSVVFPEFTVYCCKRKGAHYMTFTRNAHDDITDMVPVLDRSENKPKYNLSMCIKPMYGLSPKFLLFTEFAEHYKLQGVQHFYIYVKDVDAYINKVLMYYVKRGEAELITFREEQDRESIEWHLVGTQDCIHRSKHHSRYVFFADLDERILPFRSPTLRALITKEMEEHPNYGMMRFVTQWVLKTRADPKIYEGRKTLNEHLPTLVYQNTSSPAPVGHTAKCVLDPTKVLLMWVHHVEIYFPTYETYEVPTTDAIIRHYRDVNSGDWGKIYLPEVARFGPFRLTSYPEQLQQKLYHNVKTVLDHVYLLPRLSMFNESSRT